MPSKYTVVGGKVFDEQGAVANTSSSQTNGHALHVGGAIIINDR